jgi:hypothetical protein
MCATCGRGCHLARDRCLSASMRSLSLFLTDRPYFSHDPGDMGVANRCPSMHPAKVVSRQWQALGGLPTH